MNSVSFASGRGDIFFAWLGIDRPCAMLKTLDNPPEVPDEQAFGRPLY